MAADPNSSLVKAFSTPSSKFSAETAEGEDSPSLKTLLVILLLSIAVLFLGIGLGQKWVTIAGSFLAILMSGRIFYPSVRSSLSELISPKDGGILLASIGLGLGLIGLLQSVGAGRWISFQLADANWDAIGALGEVFGALGQILIAVLAVYVAWRQYVISKDLTIQQNTITQQQTIDTYFQGISDLVLDDEGLLEDWPQERAIAEGRTAAIFSSVDAIGKAKILRFLSRAKLLSPLKRDQRLGRPILDGVGGYAEDRVNGTRVVDLGVMLAGANLEDSDLRWVDLSEANLIRANLSNCELVKSNLARSILVGANLTNSDLNGAKLFYGKLETASPRSRTELPNYRTGEHTGAVVENADFTNAEDVSEEQRCYLCAWGGEKTRSTIPGGCQGIENRLGR
jgi:uncharacterized protein YjbI with pentapeptide repeats